MKRLILILALAVMVGCSSDDHMEVVPPSANENRDDDCYECKKLTYRGYEPLGVNLCGSEYNVRDMMRERLKGGITRIVCTNKRNGNIIEEGK